MQAGGRGDADRRRGVPLVLAAAVRVHVDVAEHDGHRLGAGGAHRHQLAAEALGEQLRDRGRAGAAHDEARRPAVRRRRGCWRGDAFRVSPRAGQRDRGRLDLPVDRQRHVDGPVGATLLAELAGAVERIDDPDARRREPRRVVDALLRQHRVVGMRRRQRGDDEVVRRAVALGADVGGIGAGGVQGGAQGDEQLPGLGGDGGGGAVVVGGGGHGGGRYPRASSSQI